MRSGATVERDDRRKRNTTDRQVLLAKLNDPTSGVRETTNYLAGNKVGAVLDMATRVRRIAIYLRVSTEEQAKMGGEAEGYSIPYQRDQCLGRVRQMGGILGGEYVDAGESAKSANRPELQKILRELRRKRIDYVVVHKIDRLARNRADDVEINALIAAAGAKLVSGGRAGKHRIVRLQSERQKLLTAHYAGALPLDMLKSRDGADH